MLLQCRLHTLLCRRIETGGNKMELRATTWRSRPPLKTRWTSRLFCAVSKRIQVIGDVPMAMGTVSLWTSLTLAGAATGIIFVATNTCFVVTKLCLSRQIFVAYFCRDKKRVLSCQTRLSRQKYACRNKTFVVTKLCCRSKTFVATKFCLSWQKYFCKSKSILLTRQNWNVILAAAPASDT